ncbi:MAG: hypothetical protein Q9168_007313 [Polycauliona sp. 1 TL-2023]
MSDPQQQTLNLPSLIIVVILVGLSIRYFFFSSSSTDTRSSNRGRGADPMQVDQVQQMFPQLNRRDIQWDLQRNGGSVQATTERVLGGRGLERRDRTAFTQNGGKAKNTLGMFLPLLTTSLYLASTLLPTNPTAVLHTQPPRPSTRKIFPPRSDNAIQPRFQDISRITV